MRFAPWQFRAIGGHGIGTVVNTKHCFRRSGFGTCAVPH